MYGTENGVATLARVYTNNGSWSTSTLPTLAQVSAWLADVSAAFDVALANEGFSVPVLVSEVTQAIGLTCESLVADLCYASHSTGRFFTEKAVENGTSPMWMVRKEIAAWVKDHATGLENMGVPRKKPGANLASIKML